MSVLLTVSGQDIHLKDEYPPRVVIEVCETRRVSHGVIGYGCQVS